MRGDLKSWTKVIGMTMDADPSMFLTLRTPGHAIIGLSIPGSMCSKTTWRIRCGVKDSTSYPASLT